MNYSKDEVMQFVAEEDVKFIRIAFCDVFGKQKNVSVMPDELPRAFEYGIAFDASSVRGFGNVECSDLFLHPDPSTLAVLPWRPEHGAVVRMYSDITYPDGTPFECDTRHLLKNAMNAAERSGFRFSFGAEQEFYLFNLDDNGKATRIPYDDAGYMDIAPEDKGENIRREICLTLEQMGIRPESSHHEYGPGQNEIDFRYSDALTAADNTETFQNVVKVIAARNGLAADFSAMPVADMPGNGFHINFSVTPDEGQVMEHMIAGVLERIAEMTLFMNPTEDSYKRFGHNRAPKYISWSPENRSQLVRIPAAAPAFRRAELRSPDPNANPYIAFALMIYASLEGIERSLNLPPAVNINLFDAPGDVISKLRLLPDSLEKAIKTAANSDFIRSHVPERIIDIYSGKK